MTLKTIREGLETAVNMPCKHPSQRPKVVAALEAFNELEEIIKKIPHNIDQEVEYCFLHDVMDAARQAAILAELGGKDES